LQLMIIGSKKLR